MTTERYAIYPTSLPLAKVGTRVEVAQSILEQAALFPSTHRLYPLFFVLDTETGEAYATTPTEVRAAEAS